MLGRDAMSAMQAWELVRDVLVSPPRLHVSLVSINQRTNATSVSVQGPIEDSVGLDSPSVQKMSVSRW
jgi:hypothetical protein